MSFLLVRDCQFDYDSPIARVSGPFLLLRRRYRASDNHATAGQACFENRPPRAPARATTVRAHVSAKFYERDKSRLLLVKHQVIFFFL